MPLCVLEKYLTVTAGLVRLWCSSDVLCCLKDLSQTQEDSECGVTSSDSFWRGVWYEDCYDL